MDKGPLFSAVAGSELGVWHTDEEWQRGGIGLPVIVGSGYPNQTPRQNQGGCKSVRPRLGNLLRGKREENHEGYPKEKGETFVGATGGECQICRQSLRSNGEMPAHHIVWRENGGGAEIANRVLLQGNCHRLVHVIYLIAVHCRLRNRGLLKA